MRQRREIPLGDLPSYSGCEYAGFCTGGCPASAMSKFGRLNARDPVMCYRLYKGEEKGDHDAM